MLIILRSPIVGQGHEQTLSTARQALLVQSKWFEDACANFCDEASVCILCPNFSDS
jgi:hypothetical protein